jgi:hypothetical protein
VTGGIEGEICEESSRAGLMRMNGSSFGTGGQTCEELARESVKLSAAGCKLVASHHGLAPLDEQRLRSDHEPLVACHHGLRNAANEACYEYQICINGSLTIDGILRRMR